MRYMQGTRWWSLQVVQSSVCCKMKLVLLEKRVGVSVAYTVFANPKTHLIVDMSTAVPGLV